MSTFKAKEIFIGAGAALSALDTPLPSIAVQSGVVGTDMLTLDPLGTDNITTQPSIYLVNKLANGDFKRSVEIKGTNVTGFKAQKYAPARRNVWGVGHQRGSIAVQTPTGAAIVAGGSIVVANSALYELTIRFKNDKSFYSQRPEQLSVSFTSAATATQLSIATQIAAAINNSKFGSATPGVKELIAVVVGDGTGAYGLTAATDYGVEITALTINQFQNTQYAEELVNFSVHVDDSTAFAGTECLELQTTDIGTGTYNQVYNLENSLMGLLDRTSWTRPTPAFLSASAGYVSGAFVLTAATTVGVDLVTFNASVATQLFAGSLITLDGVAYEIKYMLSTTVAILTSVAATTNATGAVTGKAFYDIINISVVDKVSLDGSGSDSNSAKGVIIAVPAIIVGQTGNTAMTIPSAEAQDFMDILNFWMASTPLAPAAIAI